MRWGSDIQNFLKEKLHNDQHCKGSLDYMNIIVFNSRGIY